MTRIGAIQDMYVVKEGRFPRTAEQYNTDACLLCSIQARCPVHNVKLDSIVLRVDFVL